MKKITVFIFALVFAFALNVNIDALENVIKEDIKSEELVKRSKENSKKIGKSAYVGSSYQAITDVPQENIAGGYRKTKTISGRTYVSYYKLVDGKKYNYRNSYSYINLQGNRSTYTANYLYDASACTTQEAYGCIAKYNSFYVIISETFEEKTTSGVLVYYSKENYSTKNRGSFLALYRDSRSYYSNGKIKYKYMTYKNELGNTTKFISEGYQTNGKIGYRDTTYNKSNGNLIKHIYISYNSKGKLSLKRTTNNKGITVTREGKSYYKNGKTKVKAIFKYNGKSSYLTKSGKYYKYRSNGKLQVYKNQVYNKKGYISRMDTTTYNKKGQKKSNKYGKSYKYKTYFKKNSSLITKVTRAKYSKSGKLGKYSKVKATTLTKTYYY